MQRKLAKELQPGDIIQWGDGLAEVQAVEMFMFDKVRVYTSFGNPVFAITATVWVCDPAPDETIVNRRNGWRDLS